MVYTSLNKGIDVRGIIHRRSLSARVFVAPLDLTLDGTLLTLHSWANVTGPFDCATAAWTGQGSFEGPFGTGTETYSGQWELENGRWGFRGSLSLQFPDCAVTYDVDLLDAG